MPLYFNSKFTSEIKKRSLVKKQERLVYKRKPSL